MLVTIKNRTQNLFHNGSSMLLRKITKRYNLIKKFTSLHNSYIIQIK